MPKTFDTIRRWLGGGPEDPTPTAAIAAEPTAPPVDPAEVQRRFAAAVGEGQTPTAADAFERDSAEYRRQYWNRLAQIDYQTAIAGAPSESEDRFFETGRTIVDWIEEFGLCDRDAVALDIGCGVGRLAWHAAPRVRFLHCIDVSDEMVARARETLRQRPNVNVQRTTGEKLEAFADGTLDFVYSILVLQHMERPNCRRLIGEIARVLRPGGKVLLQMPWSGSPLYTSAYEREPDNNDLWFGRVYSEDELRALFAENGLSPLAIRVIGDDLWGVAQRTAPVTG